MPNEVLISSARGLATITTIIFLLFVGPAWANKASEEFIQERANSVIEILNSSAPLARKKADLGKIVDDSVGIENVALYTLGKYRSEATRDELNRYIPAFRNYLFEYYVSPVTRFSGVILSVTGSTDLGGNKGTVVSTIVKTGLPEPTKLDWRVVDNSSIVDVKIEGVSIADVLRAQIVAVLDLSGGKISAATNLLEELVHKD